MRHLCCAVLALALLSGCNREKGTFTIIQGMKDGHALFAIIDTRFRDVQARAGLPWFLNVTTPIMHPTKDGLPTDDEATLLNQWEDSLEPEFSGECRFAYVGRVTWNGTRELLYYVDRPDSIVLKLEKIAHDGSRRDFTVRNERDEDWKQVSDYFVDSDGSG